MRQGRNVRPCEESSRLVREALGDRLAEIVAKQEDFEVSYEAYAKAGSPPHHGG
jgi:hypothetical protein